ncbi:MAG: hypothetical protein ACRDZO_24935 [Egibacteraceae bacterium]
MRTDAPADTPATAPAVQLDDEERDLLRSEVGALLPALRGSGGGSRLAHYQALADAIDEADAPVPAELLPTLESILELALQTGRARKLYRAEGERILTGVLRRTPRGRELSSRLGTVNTALQVVAGQRLDAVNVRMRTLGHYTVTIQSPAATLTLAIRPDGIEIESVTAGPA